MIELAEIEKKRVELHDYVHKLLNKPKPAIPSKDAKMEEAEKPDEKMDDANKSGEDSKME